MQFYENPDNGYYAFDLTMLDLKDKLEKTGNDFLFDYSLTDSTVVATSNKHFGKEGAAFMYYLPRGPFMLSEDKLSSSLFDDNWLP